MNFERFPSLITWSSKQSDLLDIAGEWVVTEKIHGANMCFMTDGHEVEICSRNQKVPRAQYDKFYRCNELVQQLRDPILKLFRKIPNVSLLRVYGEIYGGYYPQQETKAIPKLKPVQQEILYCNKVNFRAFKIKADDKWLSKNATILLCDAVGIECTPILFRGSGREAFQYSQDHLLDKTCIPELDGETPLEWTPNIREGHVLEPDVVGVKHIMIKHKNKEFEEYKMGRIPEPKPQRAARTDLSSIVDEAHGMMTKSRLVNVMSHDIPKTNWKEYIGEMTKDIMQELVHELNDKDTATLRKLITQRVVYPALEPLFDEVNTHANEVSDLPALIDDDGNEVCEEVEEDANKNESPEPASNISDEPVVHQSEQWEASNLDLPPALIDDWQRRCKRLEKWCSGEQISIHKWLQEQRSHVEQKEEKPSSPVSNGGRDQDDSDELPLQDDKPGTISCSAFDCTSTNGPSFDSIDRVNAE